MTGPARLARVNPLESLSENSAVPGFAPTEVRVGPDLAGRLAPSNAVTAGWIQPAGPGRHDVDKLERSNLSLEAERGVSTHHLESQVSMPVLDPIGCEVAAIDGEDLAQIQGFSQHDERRVSEVHRMVAIVDH